MIYPEIADTIRDRITAQGYRREQDGQVTYSDRLPSLKDLCAEFGEPAQVDETGRIIRKGRPLNHVTMQKALHVLVDEGKLRARDRQGYFVRRYPRLKYAITRSTRPGHLTGVPVDSWLDDVHRAGYSGRQVINPEPVLGSHRIDDYTVGDLLRLPPDGLAFARRRIRYIGMDPSGPATEPESLHDSYYPWSLVEGTPLVSGETLNTAKFLAEHGYPQVRFVHELVSRMPTRDEADRLRLPKATPVMERITVAATADGTPVYVQHTVTAGNGTKFLVEVTHEEDE
jgi:GntR family transcriptional regulator